MEGTVRRLGTLFYIVEPNATTFQHVDKVPDYINEVSVYFHVMIHWNQLWVLSTMPEFLLIGR